MEDFKNDSPFKDVAEKQVMENVVTHPLMQQRYIVALNILDMGSQFKSAKQWYRVWKAVVGPIIGKQVELKSNVEEEMVKQIYRWLGAEVHLFLNNERLVKAAKAEMELMQKLAEKQELEKLELEKETKVAGFGEEGNI